MVHGSGIELKITLKQIQLFTRSVDEAQMIRVRNWRVNCDCYGTSDADLSP